MYANFRISSPNFTSHITIRYIYIYIYIYIFRKGYWARFTTETLITLSISKGSSEGAGSGFHVFRARNRFQRYRGRRVPFSCFVLSDSILAVPSASGPVFLFCAPGLNFGSTEGICSLFHVLRSSSRFRRYRGRRVQFSYFARPDSFSAVPRASLLVFMFSSPGHVFGGTEGVVSHFHFLRSQTRFRQ
jgi:hypothetical protein